MRPQLIIITATLAACEPANLLDEVNLPIDGSTEALTLVDAGYDAAKTEATDRAEEVDARIPDDIDERVAREVDRVRKDRPECGPRAYFASRWSDNPNSYVGTAFSLDGTALAQVGGFHAPVIRGAGTFAGQWEITIDADDTREPVALDDRTRDARDLSDSERVDREPVEVEPVDGEIQINGPMGGVYGPHGNFIGAFSTDDATLPTYGVWERNRDNGGFAIGVILSCD